MFSNDPTSESPLLLEVVAAGRVRYGARSGDPGAQLPYFDCPGRHRLHP